MLTAATDGGHDACCLLLGLEVADSAGPGTVDVMIQDHVTPIA
jgi:hypothetical protein